MTRREPTVVGHLWWSNSLEVAVHDPHVGRTFRIQFKQAVDKKLRHSGGGGYGGSEKDRFEKAKDTAAEWVQDEFGYEILDKDEWSYVKSMRGMSHRDRNELAKLSGKERREMAQMLRTGEIELGGEE